MSCTPSGGHCCPQDGELAKEPVPKDAETDWYVWASQILRRVKATVCGSLWIHGSHSGERWAGVESGSEAQGPSCVSTAKGQKAQVSSETSAQALVIFSSPLEKGLHPEVFSVLEEGSP